MKFDRQYIQYLTTRDCRPAHTYVVVAPHTYCVRIFHVRMCRHNRQYMYNNTSAVSLSAAAIKRHTTCNYFVDFTCTPVRLRGDEGEGRAVSSTSDRILPEARRRNVDNADGMPLIKLNGVQAPCRRMFARGRGRGASRSVYK